MKRIASFIVMLGLSFGLFVTKPLAAQQDHENELYAFDDAFYMKVYRDGYQVKLLFVFKNPQDINTVSVERSDMTDNAFSRCMYLDYSTTKPAANDTIIKTDNYPLPYAQDVLYRLRIVLTNGVIRTYPPVKLLAIKSSTSE